MGKKSNCLMPFGGDFGLNNDVVLLTEVYAGH